MPDELQSDKVRAASYAPRSTTSISDSTPPVRLQVKWHRAGRPFGAHQRSLRFPESCDMVRVCFASWDASSILRCSELLAFVLPLASRAQSKVDAKLCNGTLCVTIQKRPESKTHRIQIAGSDTPVAIGSS